MIVLLLDKEEKIYCFTQTTGYQYWDRQFRFIDDLRYAYRYIQDEENKQLFLNSIIEQGYKEDCALEQRLLSLASRK